MTTMLLEGSVMTKPITYTAKGFSNKIGVPVIPGTNTPLTGTVFPRDAYRDIALSGLMVDPGTSAGGVANLSNPIGLGKYVTDASVDMSWDAITQITMKVEDPGLSNYLTNYFSLGSLITFNGVQYVINDVTVDGGQAGLGGVTIKCRSKAIQDIKDRQGKFDMPDASFTDFILNECKAVNASMYGQPTPMLPMVSRLQPNPDNVGEGNEVASSWTTFESFAQSSGFVVYESNGAIFFGQPTWLFDNFSVANGNIGVYWQSKESAFPSPHDLRFYEKQILATTHSEYIAATRRDSTGALVTDKALLNNTVERWDRCMSMPQIEVAYDQGPISNWTVNFEVPLEYAWSYFIGRRVIVHGMGINIEVQPLMITAVSYNLAGTGNCQVTAQTPINPATNQLAVTKTNRSAAVLGQYANTIAPGRYGKNTYNSQQVKNAIAIYNACMDYSAKNPSKGVKVNDILIALMTAITESTLHNWGNPDLPASLPLADQTPSGNPIIEYFGAPFSDHSLGLFQQRDSWGTVQQRMTPELTTVLFLQREVNVPNRLHMLPGNVCQAVQVSAFPGRYQANIGDAVAFVQALSANRGGITGSGLDGWKPGHPIMTKRASDFVNIALQMVGKPYVYGANYPNLYAVPTAFDCSSLIQWAAYQVGVQYPRDTYSQWPWVKNHRTTISVAKAAGIRGAVLFRDPEGSDAHTAISLGNGNTVQAYDTGIGVIANQARTSIANQGFDHAALIPNMVYPSL